MQQFFWNMRLRVFFTGCLVLCLLLLADGMVAYGAGTRSAVLVTPHPVVVATPAPVMKTLGYSDALILGLVQGLTEFLPISSTGHLILVDRLLGLDKSVSKDALDAYLVVIQGGAILAVLVLYWRKMLDVFLGIFGKNRNGLLLGRNLVVAFIPAGIVGLFLDKFIHNYLYGVVAVAIALVIGGFYMFIVDRWHRYRMMIRFDDSFPELHELSCRSSLKIGLLQCLALWPGISRSVFRWLGTSALGGIQLSTGIGDAGSGNLLQNRDTRPGDGCKPKPWSDSLWLPGVGIFSSVGSALAGRVFAEKRTALFRLLPNCAGGNHPNVCCVSIERFSSLRV